MSLEIHRFPDNLVEAVATIPGEQLLVGEYSSLASYLQSLELPKPEFVENKPIIVKLEDSQLNIFKDSLSEPTPLQVPRLDRQPVSRYGLLQLALASSIGKLLSIQSVRKGAVIQDIFPSEDNRSVESSSYGSETEFAFHNDLSFLDDKEIPEFVTLGCIRNPEGAATKVATINDILSGLSSRYIAELQKPQYIVHHTYRRGLPTEQVGQKQSAVILPTGEIHLGVDMTPVTNEADVALVGLRRLLKRVSTPHILQPGEVLILPNKLTAHARDVFTMSEDFESRRWLQRTNIGSKS